MPCSEPCRGQQADTSEQLGQALEAFPHGDRKAVARMHGAWTKALAAIAQGWAADLVFLDVIIALCAVARCAVADRFCRKRGRAARGQ